MFFCSLHAHARAITDIHSQANRQKLADFANITICSRTLSLRNSTRTVRTVHYTYSMLLFTKVSFTKVRRYSTFEGKFYYKQLTVNLLRKYFRTFVRKYFRTVRKYFRTSVSKLLLPYLRTKVHCTFVRKYLGTFVSDR